MTVSLILLINRPNRTDENLRENYILPLRFLSPATAIAASQHGITAMIIPYPREWFTFPIFSKYNPRSAVIA